MSNAAPVNAMRKRFDRRTKLNLSTIRLNLSWPPSTAIEFVHAA